MHPNTSCSMKTGRQRRGSGYSCYFALALTATAVNTATASPSVYPSGVTVYDHAAAYACDLLFTGTDQKTYLIDMNGHVIHSWMEEGFPPKMLDPALVGGVKGVIGVQLSSIPVPRAVGGTGFVPGLPAAFRNKTIGLVDWNGKTVWEWGKEAPGGAARQHHDWERLPGGDTMILANALRPLPGFGPRKMMDDVIYDVDKDGKTIWTWSVSDHLQELGFTPAQLVLLRHSPDIDYLHTNDMRVLGPNRWEKAGDDRFAPDNVVISSRDANFTVIISRKTGKIVWRIGPNYPARNEIKPETTPHQIDQISGQHDAYMIPEGLPGAGNILIFDNQGEAGYPPARLEVTGGSRILEIDPVKMQVVWEYTGRSSGQPDWSFFSPFISSAERLPNGNTLIDEGINGRFFQVTPQGEIVWEYISPFLGPPPMVPLPGHKPAISNWVYRVQGVPYEWVPAAQHS